MKKIVIFEFDLPVIKKEIEKLINENDKFKNLEKFNSIILSLNNEELLMKKSSEIIIKALADFEEGMIRHNINALYLTSSYLLTFKDVFDKNREMYKYSFKIEENKIYLEFENQLNDWDFYDKKIEKAIEVFRASMSSEENYKLIIDEIIQSFYKKIETSLAFVENIINENIKEQSEDDIINEIFYQLADHSAHEEILKWRKRNDN